MKRMEGLFTRIRGRVASRCGRRVHEWRVRADVTELALTGRYSHRAPEAAGPLSDGLCADPGAVVVVRDPRSSLYGEQPFCVSPVNSYKKSSGSIEFKVGYVVVVEKLIAFFNSSIKFYVARGRVRTRAAGARATCTLDHAP